MNRVIAHHHQFLRRPWHFSAKQLVSDLARPMICIPGAFITLNLERSELPGEDCRLDDLRLFSSQSAVTIGIGKLGTVSAAGCLTLSDDFVDDLDTRTYARTSRLRFSAQRIAALVICLLLSIAPRLSRCAR